MLKSWQVNTANIIFGAMYDDTNPDSATITVIATGLEEEKKVETPQKPGYAEKPLYQTSVGSNTYKAPTGSPVPPSSFSRISLRRNLQVQQATFRFLASYRRK